MNRVKEIFKIKYPIIQGGMIWCSGWELASSVSNAGGLGLIGSGSMSPEVLREHIRKCKKATNKPFGVNIPLLYKHVDNHIRVIEQEKVKVVFTSAGNPFLYTKYLQEIGVTVFHVVSSLKFALKSVDAGVNGIVCEGFEAGGHNGIDETTSLCLIPEIVSKIKLPVIAAGGFRCGKSMLAAFSLGAEGIQIGSRFAVCKESSAHINFKEMILSSKSGSTILTLKEITPVRLLKNNFYKKIQMAYAKNASHAELIDLLGKGRAKKGIFEGDLIEGELEIGQVSSMINNLESAVDIIDEIILDFNKSSNILKKLYFE